MKLYFAGSEIRSHRKILQDGDARHVAFSYMGYRRRAKNPKPWLVKDNFWPGTSVFLDSGAYTINNSDDPFNPESALEFYEHYRDFVNANLDDVEMVSEFDVLGLGIEWIEEQRDTFWKTVPAEKFMAIWHPVWGLPYLNEMASRFEIIGIPSTSLEGRELRPALNSLAKSGVRVHGVAMTKKAEMQSIEWDSVSSTSWISPQRFGDTIVWAGNELKRYPKKMKMQARKQHRTLFENEGFDSTAIENDDASEVLRLSLWSWQKFEEYINEHGVQVDPQDEEVTPLPDDSGVEYLENGRNAVVLHDSGADQSRTTALARRNVDQVLPIMSIFTPEKKEEDTEDPKPEFRTRSESARMCDSCFLAKKCPAFEKGSNCAYNIPILVRTREQFKALRYGMVEMQAQRVMFMKMAEDMEGGYADPNLTKEMNLLNQMMATVHQEEQEGFSINISARGSSQAASSGAMSRLFGREVGQQVQQLPSPVAAEQIVEAEFVEESE